MSDKRKYTVKESCRYGGKPYLPGDTIELTDEEAVELAKFLGGENTPPEKKDLGEVVAGLEQENQDLRARLEQVKLDFTPLQETNVKLSNELIAAKASAEEAAATIETLTKENGKLKAALEKKK